MQSRLLITLMSVALAATFTACGKESSSAADAAKKAAAEAAAKAKEAAVKAGEAAKEATKEAAADAPPRTPRARLPTPPRRPPPRRPMRRRKPPTRPSTPRRRPRNRNCRPGVFSALRSRVPRDPTGQRLPLLPILFAARARQVEDRCAVPRAMDVDLRIAQVRDHGEVERLRGTNRARRRFACADRRAWRRCRARARLS